MEGRIENLEDFNKFGPDKLETIHNALDGDFTAAERELISIKEKNNVMVQGYIILEGFEDRGRENERRNVHYFVTESNKR